MSTFVFLFLNKLNSVIIPGWLSAEIAGFCTMEPEGCNRNQIERVQTFGCTFSYRYVSILFSHPALTHETFIVGKRRVWIHLYCGPQSLMRQSNLWLLSCPDVLFLRLELARLEQFRYTCYCAVCTILTPIF